MMDQERQMSIMAVDDEPTNLKLLEEMLGKRGYQVRSFPRGRLALAAAIQNPPDLILLDVNMPDMNGYEVCERLGSDASLKDIPVIFLSALNDTEDKLKAFQSGAVDYITKPFQFDEVRARVETHVQLHRLQEALRRHNERLDETVRLRTRELAAAHGRLKILDQAKRDFLSLISHEFRTPLNGLLGVGEILLDESSPDGELRGMFEESRRRVLSILDDAQILSQIDVEPEKFACERLALAGVLSRAIAKAGEFARSRNVNLEPAPATSTFILGVDELLVKALQSLLETAVRFSDAGGWVRLRYRLVPEAVQVILEVCGRTIPEPVIPRFFDLLSVGEAITKDGDFGLGPAVALRILALFGASVNLENRDPAGIRLTVALQPAELGAGDAVETRARPVDEPSKATFNREDLLRRLMGDRQLAVKVVEGFLEDIPSQLSSLRKRLDEEDAPGIGLQAHQLKGSAATVAAEGLQAIAVALERAGTAGRLDRCGDLLTSLIEEFDRYKRALERAGWVTPNGNFSLEDTNDDEF